MNTCTVLATFPSKINKNGIFITICLPFVVSTAFGDCRCLLFQPNSPFLQPSVPGSSFDLSSTFAMYSAAYTFYGIPMVDSSTTRLKKVAYGLNKLHNASNVGAIGRLPKHDGAPFPS